MSPAEVVDHGEGHVADQVLGEAIVRSHAGPVGAEGLVRVAGLLDRFHDSREGTAHALDLGGVGLGRVITPGVSRLAVVANAEADEEGDLALVPAEQNSADVGVHDLVVGDRHVVASARSHASRHRRRAPVAGGRDRCIGRAVQLEQRAAQFRALEGALGELARLGSIVLDLGGPRLGRPLAPRLRRRRVDRWRHRRRRGITTGRGVIGVDTYGATGSLTDLDLTRLRRGGTRRGLHHRRGHDHRGYRGLHHGGTHALLRELGHQAARLGLGLDA